MGVRILLLYVIYQTVITASLGGVILPLSDSIGRVIPIKPKPSTGSADSSSITSSSSPICDSKDKPKSFPPSAKGPTSRDFSSPIAITSSSRALPVPKINSTSIENVKIPENIRDKLLAPCKDSVRYTKPDICPPEVSLTNKYPFSSSPLKLPNTLPIYPPLEIHKLSPIPGFTSLPELTEESSKTSDIDLLSSSSKTTQFSSLGGITLPYSDTIGKVTPIKPRPLSTSKVSSSTTSSSSPICHSKDNPILFPPAAKGLISREFSSPITITSSSRALPVPKIDSPSIKNVKTAERLKEKFLAQRKSPVSDTKPDNYSPKVFLPNKNPFSSPPSKLLDDLRTYSPLEIHKLAPLPNITSLPGSAVGFSKTSDIGDNGTPPFFDIIGKVTPVKPKPLPTSTVSSSISSSSSPICHNKDNSIFFPPAAKGPISRAFSLPIAIVSSSKALPVPKIDSTSIKNIKIPPRLREKFLAQSNSPVSCTKPDIYSPEVSLPNKNPFPSSPSKLPDALHTYSPLEIHKLSPLPSITSMPNPAVEFSKRSGNGGNGTLPFSNSIGIVTPIKPKLLPTSTVSSSIISSSFPTCHSKDNPIFFSPAVKSPISREFSSPVVITSSSRALPVPKIDSASIENVKMPERLKGKFLAQCDGPDRNSKPDICSPKASLEMEYPFLLPPSNPLEVNKLSPPSSINSLSDVPVESLKSSGFDLLSCSSRTGQLSAPVSISLSPTSRICESSSTLDAKESTLPEKLTENTVSPLSSPFSAPYPLHYNSRYLPGVKTASELLSYRPFYSKEAGNFDHPSHSYSHNLQSLPTLTFENSPNLLSHINEPYTSSYLNSIKTLQTPKPTSIPISSHIVTLSQDAVTKNLWPPKEVNAVSASVSLRGDQNLRDNVTSDLKLKSCSPTSSSNNCNTPLMPISISFPNFDVLSNKMSSFDCSKNITPDTSPVIGICTETIEKLNPNYLGDYQTSFGSKNVPSLELINLPSPSPYQYPSFTKESFMKPLKYSPPIILNEPIPTIFSSTPSFSRLVYCPSALLQTPTSPVSYINQSKTSSIGETTSNMVSSITNLLSNITHNILSPFKPNIHSGLQNKPQTPTYTIQSNSYTDTLLKLKQPSPALTIPQINPVNSISLLSVIDAPTDCINAQNSDPSTIISLDLPLPLEVSPSQPLLISSPQFTTPVLSPTSLITFSSPPLSPTYLPSPILPSYPAIASPFYIEAPVYQASASNKDSDVDNIIELMLLTEILNNDESFDWDDLDTLLTLLSLS